MRELEKSYELVTTSVNVFDLFYGEFKSGRERNVTAVRELAKRIEVLSLTEKAAEQAGKVAAELERKGMSIDFRDALIAGIAMASNTALYITNVDRFRKIEGIRLLEI